jgi:ubiquinol-cytochrome c reductase iron-sulfur subunit
MFVISIIGAIIAVWGFFAFPIVDGDLSATRNNTFWMGIGMALSMLGIGFGAVHWAKTLMPDNEVSEERHIARSSDEARAQAIEIVKLADGESGFTRRKLIRRTLYGALAFFPIPAVVIFGDLGPVVGDTLKQTMWRPGTRLTRDPTGIPIKASEVTIGSVFHVIPEGLSELEEHKLEEKAKAAVLLVRVNPADLKEDPAKASWSYDGIVAYSKICTHVGCPVALYEQHTHHLLCPCHQSTFDLADHCRVIFGPAARPLPQLPIAVDDEGYLIAQSDFLEPVGPSFWDMRK